FKPDGTKVTEVRIDAGNPVNIGPIAGAALENDTFAIVWHGGDNVAAARPHLQILRSDGTSIGPEKTPRMGPGAMAMSWLLPVPPAERGAFVVVRENGKLVLPNLFTADGTELVEMNVTHRDDRTIAGQPVVAAMQERYMVAWTERLLPEEEPEI